MTTEGDNTRLRLLLEARDLYLDVGYGRFSLRAAARRAGISPAAVYRHFKNKEALLRAVCAEGFRIFSSYLVRGLAAATARERLEASADQYLRFALEHPRDYRVMFMGASEEMGGAPLHSGELEREPTFQFLVDRVRECMQEKLIARGDAAETAAIIWAHVHGLVSLRLSGNLARVGDDARFRTFYRHATARLIGGLAGR